LASVGSQFRVRDVVQHAAHHDDIGAGEFTGCRRIEIAAVKLSEMSERAT
jgi:hypothetical protein